MNAVQSEAERNSVPFTIVGFPCNQFYLQEPGNNKTELLNLAKYVRPGNGYEPNFPWFGPVDVNGASEHYMFTFLKVSHIIRKNAVLQLYYFGRPVFRFLDYCVV